MGCDLDKRECKLFSYEGNTRRQLRVRINEHRSAINRKTKDYLGGHFSKGHGKTPAAHLTVVGFENVKIKMSAEKRQRLNEDVVEEDDVVTIRIPKAHLAAFRANKEEATGTVAN